MEQTMATPQQEDQRYLPPEIITGILSRLPVKSLHTCKCVCKSWLSLISSAHFTKLHLKENHQRLMLLFKDPQGGRFYYSLNSQSPLLFPSPITDISIELDGAVESNSCDGLFLLRDAKENLHLTNLSTKESMEIPKPPYNYRGYCFHFGLGFDPSTDSYKVVGFNLSCILQADYLLYFVRGVYIYSTLSRTNSWRRIEGYPYRKALLDGYGQKSAVLALVNGALHWLVNIDWLTQHKSVIVSLDLTEEKFRDVVLPSGCESCLLHMGVLGGCLCILAPTSQNPYGYQMWVMKEYGVKESWTKFMIADSSLCREPVCFAGDSEYLLGIFDDGVMIMGNRKERKYWLLDVYGFHPCRYYASRTYVESLVSPYNQSLQRKIK